MSIMLVTQLKLHTLKNLWTLFNL